MEGARKQGNQSEPEFVTIARVLRPQGRRGEVAAELHTDFPERFAERKRLYALTESGDHRQLELESAWLHKSQVILKFHGVDDITAAETLTGCEIQIPGSERAELEPGSAYISDLIGCSVADIGVNQRELGTIQAVQFGAGEAPLLVVKSGSKEYLLPFATEYVRKMDLEAKRLELALPEGMLDLDAPLTDEEKERQHGR